MIDAKFATHQLERLLGLNFFPSSKSAQKELVLALQSGVDETVVQSVVTEWLGSSSDAPKPAELRHLIYDKQQGIIQQRRNCSVCEGSGFVTHWYLVTYSGKSFTIKKSEQIDGGYEEAMRLARVLTDPLPHVDRQQVISVAKECKCRIAA